MCMKTIKKINLFFLLSIGSLSTYLYAYKKEDKIDKNEDIETLNVVIKDDKSNKKELFEEKSFNVEDLPVLDLKETSFDEIKVKVFSYQEEAFKLATYIELEQLNVEEVFAILLGDKYTRVKYQYKLEIEYDKLDNFYMQDSLYSVLEHLPLEDISYYNILTIIEIINRMALYEINNTPPEGKILTIDDLKVYMAEKKLFMSNLIEEYFGKLMNIDNNELIGYKISEKY